MKTDKVLIGVAAFTGGILIGKNWDKIKKFVVVSVTKIKRRTQLVCEKSAIDDKSVKTETAFISCPQCQTKLKSTTKFCHKCGEKL